MEVGPTPLIQVPIQKSDFVSRDHKLKVNGVDYVHQFQIITTVDRAGTEFKRTVDNKQIGEDYLKTTCLTVDDKVYEDSQDTAMSSEKLAEFKKTWERNWKPTKTLDASD